jgi:hypothetical protein
MWKGTVVAYFKVIFTPFLHKMRKALILFRIFQITKMSANNLTFRYYRWSYCKEVK